LANFVYKYTNAFNSDDDAGDEDDEDDGDLGTAARKQFTVECPRFANSPVANVKNVIQL
jgi:hypothetical protein